MEYSTEKEILQAIFERGFEEMSEVLQKLFNLAMKLERENVLKATNMLRSHPARQLDHSFQSGDTSFLIFHSICGEVISYTA